LWRMVGGCLRKKRNEKKVLKGMEKPSREIKTPRSASGLRTKIKIEKGTAKGAISKKVLILFVTLGGDQEPKKRGKTKFVEVGGKKKSEVKVGKNPSNSRGAGDGSEGVHQYGVLKTIPMPLSRV